MSKENFADVNGQHIFCSVHGAGKPLILLHGGIDPNSYGSNLAELAKGRQVIAVHLQAHGRPQMPDGATARRVDPVAHCVSPAIVGNVSVSAVSITQLD